MRRRGRSDYDITNFNEARSERACILLSRVPECYLTYHLDRCHPVTPQPASWLKSNGPQNKRPKTTQATPTPAAGIERTAATPAASVRHVGRAGRPRGSGEGCGRALGAAGRLRVFESG